MLEEIRKLLGPGGRFAKLCDGYEHRDEQIAMSEAVADAMMRREHLIVEAGTGVGKTVAYLTPAILNTDSDGPTVVSTHTINLQGQLLGKDIPLMRSVMSDHDFAAVLMKGRSNYVCLQEVDHASQLPLLDGDPAFARLKDWIKETQTGDISELDFGFPEWAEVCCNGDTCRHQECPYQAERCFYYRMRRAAETADLILVNHALFFSDLATRMSDARAAVIPDYHTVIFDEAHHIEDVASNVFGIEFSNYRIPHIISRIRKRRELSISPGEFEYIQGMNDTLFQIFSRARKQEFFMNEVFEEYGRERIEETVNQLRTLLQGLSTQLLEQDTSGDQRLKDRLDGYRRMLARAAEELGSLFFQSDPNYFKWGEKPSGSRFINCCLHYSPISVADILSNSLWGESGSVICTSATLSNSGTFCYLKNRVGVVETNELILGSPFDFREQALLYVPDDLDAPSEKPEYADAVAARIRDLITAAGGRAFLLFTSYRMLNEVFNRLAGDVPFRLIKQGEMSNERLIREFREDDTTCLMGVHSFWEGVDVKGERLSMVVIDKLPFAVPDTPTHKARCEQIEREGGDWFRDYAIPQAQIKLKQGFGRLIRTKTDRGVVAILDSRIHKKSYGREFVRYLPRCKATKSLDRVREFLGGRGYCCPDPERESNTERRP